MEHAEQHPNSIEGSLKKRLNVKTEYLDGFDRIKVEEPALNSRQSSNLNSIDKTFKAKAPIGFLDSTARNQLAQREALLGKRFR